MVNLPILKSRYEQGEKLKELRKKKGLTIKEVAKQTGIPAGSLSNYESYGMINQGRLEILANFYEIPIEEISIPEKEPKILI